MSAHADLILRSIRCAHENRTGGNDYILCHDCGLMWDYRKWPDWTTGAREAIAAAVESEFRANEQAVKNARADLIVALAEEIANRG